MSVQSFESYVSELAESGVMSLDRPKGVRRLVASPTPIGAGAPTKPEQGDATAHAKTTVRSLSTGADEISAHRLEVATVMGAGSYQGVAPVGSVTAVLPVARGGRLGADRRLRTREDKAREARRTELVEVAPHRTVTRTFPALTDQLLREAFERLLDDPAALVPDDPTVLRALLPSVQHIPDGKWRQFIDGAVLTGGLRRLFVGREPHLARVGAARRRERRDGRAEYGFGRMTNDGRVTEEPFVLHTQERGRAAEEEEANGGHGQGEVVIPLSAVDTGATSPDASSRSGDSSHSSAEEQGTDVLSSIDPFDLEVAIDIERERLLLYRVLGAFALVAHLLLLRECFLKFVGLP